jgi:competence protein ComEA
MKQFIRDYLTFNKRERNGLFVLLAIITLLIIYLNISNLFNKTEIVDFSIFEKEIDLFNSAVQHSSDSLKSEKENKYSHYRSGLTMPSISDNTEKRQCFNFNPNNLPDKDWKQLGLSDKQIKIIKNYESKGGTFRSKEDVKKMFCIPEKQYSALEPYIQIPTAPAIVKENTKPEITIDLNTADSIQLTKIKGIGAFYAKTIIKYRNLLGGFVEKEQLLEMWKFDSTKFETIQKFVIVDPSKNKKININTCTATELKHPYLAWNIVNGIINYRDKHGKYKTIEEIKKTDLVDEKTFRKIVPYLTLE